MSRTLTDALRNDDLDEVRRQLDAIPQADQWGDPGREFAVEVLRHGGPGLAELLYHVGAVVPSEPWPGIDPVVWAADHGACELLRALLQDHQVAEPTLRRALDVARSWLDADLEAELRRRAGVAADEPVTIKRDEVVTGDLDARKRRLRLTASGDRRAEVLIAHRAVITELEGDLEMPVTRDELLARALWSADPESADWSYALHATHRRFPAAESARWAAGRLADPDLRVRTFAATLVHYTAMDADGSEQEWATEVLGALLTRIRVEPDAEVMSDLIGAYGWLQPPGRILDELLPFTRDPRPEVRSRAGTEVLGGAVEVPPEVLDEVLALTRDPEPQVRRMATAEMAYAELDTPALRTALAARLADDSRDVRISAAYGLARRGDTDGLAELRRLSEEDGYESHAWYELDSVERQLGIR